MSKFIKELYQNIDDLTTVKGIEELLEVHVSLKCNQLLSQAVGIGTKAKLLLLQESILILIKQIS